MVAGKPAMAGRAIWGVLLACAIAFGRATPSDQSKIQILSPAEAQLVPEGQDVIVKFVVNGEGIDTTTLLNGRVLRTIQRCAASFPVHDYEMLAGENSLELLLQGNSEDEDLPDSNTDSVVTFSVVRPPAWTVNDETGVCKEDDGECPFTGGCLHEVDGLCLLFKEKEDSHETIPRIFHWVWVGGGGDIPEKFHPFMDSWLEKHPEWQFIIWTDDKITWPLRNEALLRQADTFAEVSDLIRLEVIERFGGVYIDTDFESLRPLDELIAPLSFFVGAEKDADIEVWNNGLGEVWVCPSMFGASPHHPIIQALIDGLPAQVSANLGQDPNHKTGPYYWTEVNAAARACEFAEDGDCDAEAFRAAAGDAPDHQRLASLLLHTYQRKESAAVFPRAVLYPYGWWEKAQKGGAFPDAYAVHHWQKNWGGGWNQ